MFGTNRFSSQPSGAGRGKWAKKLGRLVANAGLSPPAFLGGGGAGPQQGRKRHRLVLYQRNRDRRLRDHEAAAAALTERLGARWAVELEMHDDSRHPCDLLATLRDADVLLTPHGFQTVLLIFMPAGGAVFEIFPYK